jgi:hypothetical protein
MSEELLKILGIVVVVVFLLYLGSNALKLHLNMQRSIFEGLTNNTDSGIGGSAATYATSISQQMTSLQDSLLIKKYKTDYENVILNLDEYIGLAMLQTALLINPKDVTAPENIALLTNLNTLNAAKQSLNTVMTVVDQH